MSTNPFNSGATPTSPSTTGHIPKGKSRPPPAPTKRSSCFITPTSSEASVSSSNPDVAPQTQTPQAALQAPQAAYPPQAYPPQSAYPQQAYPQQSAYPHPHGHPQQDIFPQAGWETQGQPHPEASGTGVYPPPGFDPDGFNDPQYVPPTRLETAEGMVFFFSFFSVGSFFSPVFCCFFLLFASSFHSI
eukprot:TRINITY_DN5801_c0_g1_i2.p1 TRINITY_DN5801_c0_g1~~TRINITY_DN5801_c0_g1_i2.p1  ORF type:complete len:197 (-),score=36.34 TRINITY_DN5801_c0_g1_i2:357-920(-)